MRNDKIKKDWKSLGFDSNMARSVNQNPKPAGFIGGANFDAELDDILFNRMIKLKNLVPAQAPQGVDIGKIYYDPTNQKYKMWIGPPAGWVDVQYTSTSTSTTSSSSSSSSTSSTSSSTSSTSSSTSSTSSSSTSTTHT
jgi:hypothetical protein